MILEATRVSLTVVLISVMLTLFLAILAVKYIALSQRTWIKFCEVIIMLPMFIPPSAIGYLILLTFGKNGIIGKHIEFNIIFTIYAAIIAAIVVTLPIMYQSIKTSVLGVENDIIDAARVYGANEWIIFKKIILPLSKHGILNGILLCFARAFGEFGATILVAGNIVGKTQTLPMALYYAIEQNNEVIATKILIIVFSIAIFLMSLYSVLIKKNRY